jgi:hypothetical protein
VDKTYVTKAGDAKAEWYVVDATGQTLGRLATRVAGVLLGKHKPIYSPAVNVGDYVIVVNAEKVRVTGRKLDQKIVLALLGLPRRAEADHAARPAAQVPHAGDRARGAGDVAEEPIGRTDVWPPQGVCRARSPTRGAAAQATGVAFERSGEGNKRWTITKGLGRRKTATAGAFVPRWRVHVLSPSTSGRSRSTFVREMRCGGAQGAAEGDGDGKRRFNISAQGERWRCQGQSGAASRWASHGLCVSIQPVPAGLQSGGSKAI